MSEDQQHAHLNLKSGDRRVAIAICANALLTLAQIGGGLLSGSLALVADALHNFSDMASLAIAFAARKIARRPADSRMTYGYGRIEVVAALINYTTLVIVGIYLIYEGGMRMLDPPEVAGWTVVFLGAVALIVDTLTALLTYSMQKGSVNIRALFLHNLSDALASVAVVGGGALILLYDMRWVDPAITIGIALYVLYLALTEIGGPIRILMLGSPPNIDGATVIDAVAQGVGREAGKNDRMHGTDAGTGQHDHGQFGDHGQVDADSIALADAPCQQGVGHAADIGMQLAVGDLATLAHLVGLPDDGHLVTAFGQVAVQAVGGHVELAALEPVDGGLVEVPAQGGAVGMEPVQPFGDLVPKGGRIVDGRLVALLIGGHGIDAGALANPFQDRILFLGVYRHVALPL